MLTCIFWLDISQRKHTIIKLSFNLQPREDEEGNDGRQRRQQKKQEVYHHGE